MTNIHLIGGEKGGVGKSLLARLMAQYLIDQSMPFIGFDSDRTHGALLRFTRAMHRRFSSTITRVSTPSSRRRPRSRSGAFSWIWPRKPMRA
jgi:CO dehydrogenase nickel-insertion accessory protein CooC1